MQQQPAKLKAPGAAAAAAAGAAGAKVDPAAAAVFLKMTLEEQKRVDVVKYCEEIYYSERYSDDESEYRHVSLPEGLRKYLPHPPRLMSEAEWRGLGVRQSAGWQHYMVHEPEPHVLLFKRERDFQLKYAPSAVISASVNAAASAAPLGGAHIK
ncbi:hypothetical protein IWW48_004985 [Coemansia sp. RSA 1200]|nr:hypothetical protein IWW48_004985 [Coemansia sp. RSA 1200]